MNKYLTVSRNAMTQPPSKIGLRANEKITVRQAISILVTRSANDVAVALAETVGGSEKRFTQMMTQRAHSLGMKNSFFYNPSGLPNPAQKSSAHDMAILARALMQYFPQHYHVFKTIRTNYRGQTIETHNNLMRRFSGMDGLKTGFTNASGFNLVASAVRHNKRVIVVVFGGRSAVSRDNHVADLMNRGLAQLERNKTTLQVAATAQPSVTATAALQPVPANNIASVLKAAEVAQGDAQIQPVQSPSAAMMRPETAGTAVAYNNTPAAAGANKSWGIQIGAFSSSAMSQQTLIAIQARLRPHLETQGQPVIIPTSTPQGVVYRARIIGLSARDAGKACDLVTDCMAFTTR